MKNEWILPPLAWRAYGQIYLFTLPFHVPIMQFWVSGVSLHQVPFFPLTNNILHLRQASIS